MLSRVKHGRKTPARSRLVGNSLLIAAVLLSPGVADEHNVFVIRCVDRDTGRGIPLVELRSTTNVVYMSDSAGVVAIEDPALMNRQVYFHVFSHGYEKDPDGFGYRGKRLQVKPGTTVTVPLKRQNVAERLYRTTGAGIYRDSVIAGLKTPIKKTLLNASVTGQDSVQAAQFKDRIYWFWGDTNRLRYPLGQFNTSGATSRLASQGGLPPDKGIDFTYFADDQSFSRPMFSREPGVLIWIHGLAKVQDKEGNERLVTHYTRRESLAKQLSHGIASYDANTNQFELTKELPESELLYPRGHAFHYQSEGTEYIYFADPYPALRVPATYEAFLDPSQYEAYTPLRPRSKTVEVAALERNPEGRLRYAWKRATAPVGQQTLHQWVSDGKVAAEDNHFRTVDVSTGETIVLQRGSVRWNPYRQRWIMIANQVGGSSFLGEVWYSESIVPKGPYSKAVKVVSHRDYSFYNVTQHPFFDSTDGQKIYFEGTYSKMFSGTKTPTPWYDYNQIMYRLDLTDVRLETAQTP